MPSSELQGVVSESIRVRSRKILLIDWGDTVMRVFPGHDTPMADWPVVELMPHVSVALGHLSGTMEICLATNAQASTVDDINRALHRCGIDSLFDRIYCQRTVGAAKPSPAFFRHVLDDTGAEAADVVMVGDDFQTDVLGANALGIRAIWLNSDSEDRPRSDLYRTIGGLQELAGTLRDFGF